MTTARSRRRLPALVLALALVAGVATACEPRVTGQVLFAGDFLATDASPWVAQSVSISATGFLPVISTVPTAGVRDTAYWAGRFDALDDRGGLDAVVLSLGMNDVASSDLTSDLPTKIAAVADAAGDGGRRPVLWATLGEGSPGRESGAIAFNAALRTAASSRPNLTLLDFGAELAAHPEYLADDGLHWTVTGQRAFADLVALTLEGVPTRASLSVTHDADTGSLVAGGTIRYRVTVTNTGAVALHHVTAAAPAAPGCSGSLPDLEPGAVHHLSCAYTTTSNDVGTRHSTVTVTSDEASPTSSNQVDVTVRAPAATIRGTVTTRGSGSPVAGAWVIALRAADYTFAAGAEASSSGDYTLAAGAGSYLVYVIDPARDHLDAFYGAPSVVSLTAGATVTADPVLDRLRGSVTGTVREAGGTAAPIPGAWVLALATSGTTGEPEAAAASSSTGTYTLPDLRPGPHFLGFVDPTGAHAPRFHPASSTVPGARPVDVSAGATATADVALVAQPAAPSGAGITGTVLDEATGQPVPAARVVALRASDFALVRGTIADDGGRYRLDVPAGAYKLAMFDAIGAHRVEWYDDRPAARLDDAAVVVAPGVADAALTPTSGGLRGRVTDEASGAAMGGAWVVAVGPSGIAGAATTAADGTYVIAGLEPGTHRVAVIDPTGAHPVEFFEDGASYLEATPLTVGAGSTARADVALAAPRTNVVLILTDDQTLESMRVMPRVQAHLAAQGTTFANAFATYPLCCPARATLLTGQYSHNHGVVNNVAVRSAPNPPIGGSAALDHTNTLATWLQEAGYQTAHVGKYLNCWGNDTTTCRAGAPAAPPGWDRWFGLIDPYPANYGYSQFDVLDGQQIRRYGPAPDVYQTDVLADRAVEDVHRLSAVDRPFFLNVWTQAPHAGPGSTAPNNSSPAPAPRHTGLFLTERPPATPAVGETDVGDKPSYIRCGIALSDQTGSGPNCNAAPTSTWTNSGLTATYRATLQSLQAVDEMVERVVQALTDAGELDHTVIVFTSDNGFLFGEHRLSFRKVVPYEESVHVPLVVRGPGFPAGQVATQLVGNIDVAPTLVAVAGATPRRVMDGRSLLPLAQDPTIATRRALLLEDWPAGAFVGIPPHYDGVRAPTDVYLQYANGEREYYDLTTDPYQLVSRHADASTASRRTALAALLNQLKTCSGASCEVVAPP